MTRSQFEWDANKDAENQRKHGVPFSLAQYAFADSRRVIAKPYLPGEEIGPGGGPSRAHLLMARILAIPEDQIGAVLDETSRTPGTSSPVVHAVAESAASVTAYRLMGSGGLNSILTV